jgi:hypothetical protein
VLHVFEDKSLPSQGIIVLRCKSKVAFEYRSNISWLTHDFKLTVVEVNIWRAFKGMEFYYDISPDPYALLFDAEKFRSGKRLKQIWAIGFPAEHLVKRLRMRGLAGSTIQISKFGATGFIFPLLIDVRGKIQVK